MNEDGLRAALDTLRMIEASTRSHTSAEAQADSWRGYVNRIAAEGVVETSAALVAAPPAPLAAVSEDTLRAALARIAQMYHDHDEIDHDRLPSSFMDCDDTECSLARAALAAEDAP